MILRRNLMRQAAAGAFAVALSVSLGAHAAPMDVSYEQSIQPVFDAYCVQCHQPGGEGFEASGLDLSTYEGAMKGTRLGPMIVPGDPVTSNLMAVIEGRTDASISMPHSQKRGITKEDRKALRKWIMGGATEADYNNGAAQIIAELCLHCHTPDGPGYEASGLDMRTYASLMKGTNFGPVIVPGDPITSNFMVLIDGRASGSLKMPHDALGKPSSQEKVMLRRWIHQGAVKN